MMLQLDLFETVSAEVVAFPLSRRAKLVATASEYMARSDAAEATRFWRELLREPALPLLRIGIDAADIRAEAFAFRAAVQAQLSRIGPDGPTGDGLGVPKAEGGNEPMHGV